MTLKRILNEFDEKYRSFEFGEPGSKDQFWKLKAFLTHAIRFTQKARDEEWRERIKVVRDRFKCGKCDGAKNLKHHMWCVAVTALEVEKDKLGMHGKECPHCSWGDCECHCKICRPDLWDENIVDEELIKQHKNQVRLGKKE